MKQYNMQSYLALIRSLYEKWPYFQTQSRPASQLCCAAATHVLCAATGCWRSAGSRLARSPGCRRYANLNAFTLALTSRLAFARLYPRPRDPNCPVSFPSLDRDSRVHAPYYRDLVIFCRHWRLPLDATARIPWKSEPQQPE